MKLFTWTKFIKKLFVYLLSYLILSLLEVIERSFSSQNKKLVESYMYVSKIMLLIKSLKRSCPK